MRPFGFSMVAAIALGSLALPAAAQKAPSYEATGPLTVAVMEGVWHDTARKRDVPYLIRYPASEAKAAPVIIFSHGLGGSANGAPYYGNHLASHGFVVAYVQHPGTDTAIWKSVVKPGQPFSFDTIDRTALMAVVADPRVTVQRFLDIPFALKELSRMNSTAGPLRGKLDMQRLGMSGHSFGAVTTQAMAGQIFRNGQSMPEPAFKAFLAMSPSGDPAGDNERAFGKLSRPFLFLTGTKDDFSIRPGDTGVAERRLGAYAAIHSAPASLMVLTDGDHMIFSGRQELGGSKPTDDRHRVLIKAASLAFWAAYLKDDDDALHWLRDGGLKALAGADARIENKGPARSSAR